MSGTAPRARLRERLRDKLPEIFIEAGSVVLALLLAFAINEWHDRRQEEERAAVAREAILRELHANASEIASTRNALAPILASLRGALDETQAEPRKLEVNLNLSLLSSAAWHAALATQASQRIDFEWMTRVAKVYELQDNFLHVQEAAVDELAALPPGGDAGGRRIAAGLLPRFNALAQLADGLAASYVDVFGDGTVRDAAH
ncbi:hypothetical protein FHW12_002444 [Dokdonella fugitiva]|uniref:Uncharacterized protein n=1 Tax=Dokdonella fugitiva TaxID=328517 RepID=A0A839F571_9GAMM|nr:hypothetical protein [Dokdonella fugitiva]MBA8888220.1 hypothetical protein [Dokdonella fugitiva]